MKYYHIIYNSSEKNVKGMPGYGIRTHSKDLKPELLQAIGADKEIFQFVTKGARLTPAMLVESPEEILKIHPSYIFANIGGHYVMGRKVAVGFDYAFYMNGNATRLGNYVGDYYIADELSDEMFALLDPAEGGKTHFIPFSPVPSQENEEMKAIELGQQELLEPMSGELGVKFKPRQEISEKALWLLFAFIDTLKDGDNAKPVIVKLRQEETLLVLADFFRALPPAYASKATFLTNYHEMGRKVGFNIFFTNEDYQVQVMEQMWRIVDLNDLEKNLATREQEMFAPIVKEYAEKGEWSKVRMIMESFVLRYAEYSGCDAQTMNDLISFVTGDDSKITDLVSNSEKMSALSILLKELKDKADIAKNAIKEKLGKVENVSDVIAISAYLKSVAETLGEDFANAGDAKKRDYTVMCLKDADTFADFYKQVKGRFADFVNVFDKEEMRKHSEYLEKFKKDDWLALYKLLLNENVSSDYAAIFDLANKHKLDDETKRKALDDAEPNAANRLEKLCDLIKTKKISFDEAKSMADSDFNVLSQDLSANASSLISLLCKVSDVGDEWKKWITKDKTSLFDGLLGHLKECVRNGNVKDIENNASQIVKKFQDKENISKNWCALQLIAKQEANEKNIEEVLEELYSMANDLDKQYLKEKVCPVLFKKRIDALPKDISSPKSFVDELKENIGFTYDEIFEKTKKREDKDAIWAVALEKENPIVGLKVKELVKRLNGLFGAPEAKQGEKQSLLEMRDDAKEFLKKNLEKYADAYAVAYNKSLSPSFFSKIMGIFGK